MRYPQAVDPIEAAPAPEPPAPPRGDRRAEFLLALPIFAAVGVGLIRQMAQLDADYFWQLATGQAILARGLPAVDPFSWTYAGVAWRPHEWLTDVALAGLYGLAGPTGPVALMTAAALAVWVLLYVRARRLGATRLVALGLVVASLVAVAPFTAPRPLVFLWLAAALTALIVERVTLGASPRLLLALPPLAALAANLHAGAPPLMAVIVGLAAVQAGWEWGRRSLEAGAWRRGVIPLAWSPGDAGRPRLPSLLRLLTAPRPDALLLLVATAAAVLVAGVMTPAGVDGLALVGGTLTSAAPRALIEEWRSPDFHRPEMRAFGVLLLVGLPIVGRWGARLGRLWLYGLLLVGGAAAAGLDSARHIPLYVLLAGPVLAAAAPAREKPLPRPRRLLAILAVVVSVVLAAVGLPLLLSPALAQRERTAYPQAAVTWLVDHAAGQRLFHEYDWGGYLIARGVPVFIDGRAEVVYPADFLFDFRSALIGGPGWRSLFARTGVDTALLRPDTPLTAALQEAGWQVCWRDDQAIIARPTCP